MLYNVLLDYVICCAFIVVWGNLTDIGNLRLQIVIIVGIESTAMVLIYKEHLFFWYQRSNNTCTPALREAFAEVLPHGGIWFTGYKTED